MATWRSSRRKTSTAGGSWPSGKLRWAAQHAAAATLSVLYPPTCPLCLTSLDDQLGVPSLCNDCTERLLDRRPACVRCARPLPPSMASKSRSDCVGCHRKQFGFQEAIALGVYGKELRDVVLRIKKTGNESLSLVIGKLLGARCRALNLFDSIDLLAPVPIHWIRRVVRGGSCPELLCEAISSAERVPAVMNLIRCRRNTKKQGTLLPSERRQNVRNAYRVSAGYDVKDAHVLLVDDVMTTGETANELARVLQKAGASRITLAVVARGIGFD